MSTVHPPFHYLTTRHLDAVVGSLCWNTRTRASPGGTAWSLRATRRPAAVTSRGATSGCLGARKSLADDTGPLCLRWEPRLAATSACPVCLWVEGEQVGTGGLSHTKRQFPQQNPGVMVREVQSGGDSPAPPSYLGHWCHAA